MKHLLAAILFVSLPALANPVGAGIILFGPTGFTANYFLNKQHSIDAALSWSLNDDDQNFYIHSTYLWHRRNALKVDSVQLHVYYGGGGRLISWEDKPGKSRDSETRLGVRGAGGLRYIFKRTRLETFGEASLTMDVIPETDADLDFGLGLRYYF